MDKNIVATPIPPGQPEPPRLIMRIAGVCLGVGLASILIGGFWPAVGPWLVGIGIFLLIAAGLMLLPYWRPSDRREKTDDIRKLHGQP
jgi:threonine/homoserine efflux transporter RhtA